MRKTLKVVAIAALALLVAAPAMALDFKFGAEYRVRFFTNTNGQKADLGRDDGAFTQRGAQIRVRPRFDVSDDNGNITATLRLEIGDINWGIDGGNVGRASGGAIGADGVNVETKWAYIDFMSPFGIPLRWRAGIQPWFESKGLIIDDDVAGVRAYGKTGAFSYELGWYRPKGQCDGVDPAGAACRSANNLDNNYDFYEGKVGFSVAPWLNPTVYYIYGDNRATNTAGLAGSDISKPVTSQFLGARLDGKFNIFSYDLDFIYGTANGGPTGDFAAGGNRIKTKGYVLDGGLHFPIGPTLLHVVGSYATGDKQNGGDSEAMPFISPSWHGAGGLYELIGNGGTFDQVVPGYAFPAGLWMLGGGVEYRPVKALWLRGMYGYAGFTNKEANCATGPRGGGIVGGCFGPRYDELAGQSGLGHEISFRADWNVWTNFKIQGGIGWLLPSEGSTVAEYVLQLYYNF